jgi:hypothetical protein
MELTCLAAHGIPRSRAFRSVSGSCAGLLITALVLCQGELDDETSAICRNRGNEEDLGKRAFLSMTCNTDTILWSEQIEAESTQPLSASRFPGEFQSGLDAALNRPDFYVGTGDTFAPIGHRSDGRRFPAPASAWRFTNSWRRLRGGHGLNRGLNGLCRGEKWKKLK